MAQSGTAYCEGLVRIAILVVWVAAAHVPILANGRVPPSENGQAESTTPDVVRPGTSALSGTEQLYPFYDWEQAKFGHIDRDGAVVCLPQFDDAFQFTEGLGAVAVAGKWGFIDASGSVVIPAQFDGFRGFSDGFAAVEVGELWGYINAQGDFLASPQFDDARSFSEGLAPVRIGQQWGYVNSQVELVIPATFGGAWPFTQGRAPVKIGERWGFIDGTGQVVIAPVYYWVDNFSEGLAFVEGGLGQEGYIDPSGSFAIQRRFYGANPFTAGVAAVLGDPGGTWDLIDSTGTTITSHHFEAAGLFFDGLARVLTGDYYYGYIDPTGAMQIQPTLQWAGDFSGGLALVHTNSGRQAYIDTSGAVVWMEPNESLMGTAPRSGAKTGSPVMPTTIHGPTMAEPPEISLVGNPYRQRWPDDSGDLVFSRNIWDMIFYEGRIYTGCGDYWNNTGPAEIYSFRPGTVDFLLEYRAPEEMVSVFYVFEERLVVPGNDPRESWDWGNIHIKEDGTWRKVRTIPNGLHCFDLAYVDDTLFAIAATEHAPNVLASQDWGQTWESLVYDMPPGLFYVYDNRLHFQGWNMLVRDRRFGSYENGVFYTECAIPRLQLLSGEPADPPLSGGPSFGRATPFGDHVVFLWSWYAANPEYGPCPLFIRFWNCGEPVMVDLFAEDNVLDLIVREDTLYVLCTHEQSGQYENAIWSTQDLQAWTCVATFTTDSFARSFVEACGAFYVSIGCGWPDGEPLPPSTGDILRVVPADPLPPGHPHIALNPDAVYLATRYGIDPETSTFTIANTGCPTLDFNVGDDADWLEVSPESGSTTVDPVTIQLICTVAGLDPGIYETIVTVADPNADNSPQTLCVTLEVHPVPGDFDADTDVDQEDFGHLQACLTGPGISQNDPTCVDARLDGDDDVDMMDLSILLGCMSGPNVGAQPDCAP